VSDEKQPPATIEMTWCSAGLGLCRLDPALHPECCRRVTYALVPEDPAWLALQRLPVVDTLTLEEKTDCEIASAEIRDVAARAKEDEIAKRMATWLREIGAGGPGNSLALAIERGDWRNP
jgi:hypothetical protein